MTEITLTDNKLKELLKLALTEVLQEQRELFAEVVLSCSSFKLGIQEAETLCWFGASRKFKCITA
ncbi:MAG: hypothetical protein NW220_03125 [Leptolyngbyaceae cyanobacterium bins.349]|nr:hypothetical protein [Leptolyngbyaceae cyanobacterium bins.349]